MIVAILGARWPDLATEAAILEPAGAELRRGPGTTAAEIAAVAGDADVILAGPHPPLQGPILGKLPCIGVVRYGVGVDNVDLDEAARLGKWVVNVPDYGTEAVAMHALALALAGMRRLVAADRVVRSGDWGFRHLTPLHLPATSTAGVVGLGRIGRRTAQLMAAVGFSAVIGHDPVASAADLGIADAPLAEVLTTADVVSLHAPATHDGRPLLTAPHLGRMKEGSVLVNTARGSLVDGPALAAALAAGRPAVAALDVFPGEPPDLGVFADVLDRMILTPHMAWYTEETEQALREGAAREALRLLRGERPVNPVVDPGSTT